jgi:hypothetical protein
MKEIDLVYRTIYAELLQRSLDAAFEGDFGAVGNFVIVPVKGKDYWYFDQVTENGVKRRYVGPANDQEIAKRVEDHKQAKGDVRARRKLVSTLTREAGLPSPDRVTGDIVEALANARLFRLRGVLVGTVAYQSYSALVGIRLPVAAMQTGDADFAQFHSISAAVEDSVEPMLGVLRAIDASFREIPHQSDGRQTTKFENATRYQVEFLTPNTGSDDNEGKPSRMPALGGASAQPLRFLDFLILDPVRAVLLHKAGVPVLVPAPERFALHKLIVASRRRSDQNGVTKRDKDVMQADLLLEAMAQVRRQSDLAVALAEAHERGHAWREALTIGLSYLAKSRRQAASEILREGLRDIGEDTSKYDAILAG